jgi:4-amino-4-deoxy-L-arabinose transferase-like glycosyltransferase
MLLSRSDFWLRIPSVVADGVMVWVAYRWASRALGRHAALVAALLLAFAPEMISIGSQVRPYAVMNVFLALALLCLERGRQEQSAAMIVLSGLMTALAAGSQYSAFFFAFAVGAYGLYLAVRGRIRGRVLAGWAAGQAVAAGALVLLYMVYISRHHGGATEAGVKDGFLSAFYYIRGRDSMLLFPFIKTAELFHYAFSSWPLAALGVLGFAAGVVTLLTGRRRNAGLEEDQGKVQDSGRKRAGGEEEGGSQMSELGGLSCSPWRSWRSSEGRTDSGPRRDLALLLVLPFVVACAAALLGLYPYGGIRHVFYLVFFAAAGIGVAVSRLLRQRFLPVLAAAAVAVPIWNVWFDPPGQYLAPKDQRRTLAYEAVAYIRQMTPPGQLVYSDQQTALLLRRYFSANRPAIRVDAPEGFVEMQVDGYRLVAPAHGWSVGSRGFGDAFEQMARAYGLGPGQMVTVADAGWGWNLGEDIECTFRMTYPGLRRFGARIAVWLVPVGSEPGTTERARLLDSLLAVAPSRQFRTVFLPSDQLSDSVRLRAARVGTRVLGYGELYEEIRQGKYLSDYTPVLAFWSMRNVERHPKFIRTMDEGAERIVGGYRFLPVGADPGRRVAAYRIDAVAGDLLLRLTDLLSRELGTRFRTVLWPTDFMSNEALTVAAPLGERVRTYTEVYREMQTGHAVFDDNLPALALWVFGTPEGHPEFMAYMDDRESYVSSGYSFTFLGIDPTGTVAAYVIEPAESGE